MAYRQIALVHTPLHVQFPTSYTQRQSKPQQRRRIEAGASNTREDTLAVNVLAALLKLLVHYLGASASSEGGKHVLRNVLREELNTAVTHREVTTSGMEARKASVGEANLRDCCLPI